MMCRFFVVSGLMMFSCFAVVTRGMRMVLCRLFMMLGCFLGHSCFLCLVARMTYSNGKQWDALISETFLYDVHGLPSVRFLGKRPPVEAASNRGRSEDQMVRVSERADGSQRAGSIEWAAAGQHMEFTISKKPPPKTQ
jgi:hypothetical protein